MANPWPVGVACLSLAVVIGALLLPGRGMSTRATPAALFMIGTGIAFAFSVHPTLGVLATLGGYWWFNYEWRMSYGGTFWPFMAAAVQVGMNADPAWWHAGLVALLVMGVFQTGVGICQYFKLPVMLHPEMIHGSLGHRTGYGIFLALLAPLAFITDYGILLACFFGIGIVLSRSSVAAGSYLIGLVMVMPGLWIVAGVIAATALVTRSVKIAWDLGPMPPEWRHLIGHYWIKGRHLSESWIESRLKIWKATLQESLVWPSLLIGHGPNSFDMRAQSWWQRWGFRERYRECHNDYLEFFFEYGLVGIIGVSLWFVQYGPDLHVTDPLTGTLAAMGTAMLANFPMRVATLSTIALVVMITIMRRSVWVF